MRKLITWSLGILLSTSTAHAADYNLRFSHFWPATSGVHQGFEQWANSLESASQGRIKVEFYPAQTLTKAPKSYDGVKKRITDITATVQGYNANRFPLTQIIELPGMADSAAHGSCILQSMYDDDLLSYEYRDTQVLFLFTHGPGYLHTRNKAIKQPKDLAGLKIRRPTTVVAQLLESQGAQPVGMPAPETYPALQRGILDGVAFPWEAMKGFRTNEQASFHNEVNLYTLSFVVAMNKKLYQDMPADLKLIMQEHSGTRWSQHMAQIFDELDSQGRAQAVAAEHTISPPNLASWQPVFAQSVENYLNSLEQRRLPSRDVYQRALEFSASCTR